MFETHTIAIFLIRSKPFFPHPQKKSKLLTHLASPYPQNKKTLIFPIIPSPHPTNFELSERTPPTSSRMNLDPYETQPTKNT